MSDYPTNVDFDRTDPPRHHDQDNKTLKIALGVVALLAVLGPLVVYLSTRGGNDNAAVSTGDVATVTPVIEAAPTPVSAAVEATTVPPAAATAAPAAAPAPASTAVVTQLTGDAAALYKVTGIQTGSSLNVRKAPGATNALLGSLAFNATGIESTGLRSSVDGAEWREIKYGTGTGWVFAGYLTAAPAPAAAAPSPTATPTPAIRDLAGDEPAIYEVVGINEGAALTVRTRPGPDSVRIGTLPNNAVSIPSTGARIQVGEAVWREIGFRTGTGWVDASFLRVVPAAPQTVLLPSVESRTVGIVGLTSATDRLVLRADPGYDQDVAGTVGASAVNVTATGKRASIGSEEWIEITTGRTSGWVPRLLTINGVQSWQNVLDSSGVANVRIDQVTVAANGQVELRFGDKTVTVKADATVMQSSGASTTLATWAESAKSSSDTRVEVTVQNGQIVKIWIY